MIGNTGANVLEELGGDDHPRGQADNDTLTGETGHDFFGFNTPLGAANVDAITDFSVADDTIELYKATFTTLMLGTLAAAAFRANTAGLAGDADDRIIYETETGELYYDANGTGAGGGILFAKLATGLALTNLDFSVV